MATYAQTFSFDVEAPADQAWAAVRRAVDGMDGASFATAHEAERRVDFTTGVTATSWGQQLRATVTGEVGRSTVSVVGKPTGTFLTTRWGEAVHSRGVERRLRAGVEQALAAGR